MKKDKPKNKKSLFDRIINLICYVLFVVLTINEFSHLYRSMQKVGPSRSGDWESHYSVSTTFPFVGRYFLMKPRGYDPGIQYPLVVALHGAGSSRVYAAEALAKSNFRSRYPVFVMVPIAPPRAFWSTPENTGYALQRLIPYPDHLPQVISGIKAIQGDYNIDQNRIYVVGHSMGGAGVVAALEHYPNQFAAGVSSAGIWDPAQTTNINDPLWLLHGVNDVNIPHQVSRDLYAYMKAQRKDVLFNSIKRQGHGIGDMVFGQTLIWDWLFKHKNNQK